jgi:hypothetical protein
MTTPASHITGILTQEETVKLILNTAGFEKLLTEAELQFVERALGIAYSLGFAAGIEQGFERSLGLLRKLDEKREREKDKRCLHRPYCGCPENTCAEGKEP